MSSGAASSPPLRVPAPSDAEDDAGSPSTSVSSAPSTSVLIPTATPISISIPSSPATPIIPSSPAPFLAHSSTPPSRKTSFQASEIDRPWLRSELLSPTRCSSQFFDEGPYDFIADLDGPPRPPYARSFSDTSSMSSRFSLLPDPGTWGSANDTSIVELDDELHEPDPERDTTTDKGGTIWTCRGVSNLGCLILLIAALFGLFAGFPLAYSLTHKHPVRIGYDDKTNSTGQVPARLARYLFINEPGR